MLDQNILNRDEYQKLANHVKNLLKKVQPAFGNNDNDYALYLAYLILSNPDEIAAILPVNKGIQLLLQEIDKFWLDNTDISVVADTESDILKLKRALVKYMLLNELDAFVTDKPNIKNNQQLKDFITKAEEDLENVINESALIETIFQQNMDFASKPKNSVLASHALRNIKNITGSAFATMAGINSVMIAFRIYNTFIRPYADPDDPRAHGRPASLVALCLLAPTYFVTQQAFGMMMRYINTPKHPWQNMSRDDFVAYCQRNQNLLSLIPEATPVGSIWTAGSHISDLGAEKSPIYIKQFMEKELNDLKAAMEPIQFINLLTSLILNSKIPYLTDVRNSLPVEYLRNPELWIRDTALEDKDCYELLETYFKKAIVDFVNTELAQIELTEEKREEIKKLIFQKSSEFNQTIERLNSLELKDKTSQVAAMFKALLPFVIMSSVFSVTLLLQVKNVQQKWHEEGIEPKNVETFRFIATIVKTIMNSGTASAISGAVYFKFPAFFQPYKDWKDGMTVKQFIQQTERTLQSDQENTGTTDPSMGRKMV